MGSTFTSMSFRRSAPSPGLTGASRGDDHILRSSRRACRLPRPPRPPPPPPMRSSIFSPLADRSKPATLIASFSGLRVFRSNFESVPPPPPPRPPRAGFHQIDDCPRCPVASICNRRAGTGSARMRCSSLSKSMRTGLGGPRPRPALSTAPAAPSAALRLRQPALRPPASLRRFPAPAATQHCSAARSDRRCGSLRARRWSYPGRSMSGRSWCWR